VRALLEATALPYEIDHRLVRGLDYYTRTAFEILSNQLGAQDALCGGGRYDLLCEELGGSPTAAVGFAAGMERLLMVLGKQGARTAPPLPTVFVAPLGNEAQLWAFASARQWRRRGWRVEVDLLGRSLKAQLREANRQQAVAVVIVGDSELAAQSVQVKDLRDGTQVAVGLSELEKHLAGYFA